MELRIRAVSPLFQPPTRAIFFSPQGLLKSLCTTSLQRMWRLPCNLIAIFRSRFEQEIFAGQAPFDVRSLPAQRCEERWKTSLRERPRVNGASRLHRPHNPGSMTVESRNCPGESSIRCCSTMTRSRAVTRLD